MEVSIPHRKTRLRAPRCNELDNPQIRMEIEVLYIVRGLNLEDIVKEVNKGYGLNATKSQYRDRLRKWGCRKRLTHREYQFVHKRVNARKRAGKESDVLLSGIVGIPDNSLQKWASRNISFTDRMLLNSNANAIDDMDLDSLPSSQSPFCVQVCTPPANSDTTLVITSKRHIPISVLHALPIWQATKYLDEFVRRYVLRRVNANSAVAYSAHPHLSLLRNIVYRISNHLYFDPFNLAGEREGIHSLLGEVDKFRLRKLLLKLLLNHTPSIVATCEVLVPYFYLRKDDELFETVCTFHQLKFQLYQLLDEVTHDPVVKTGRRRSLQDILANISAENLQPRNAREATSLLQACKIRGDLSVFFKLWNKDILPVWHLEIEAKLRSLLSHYVPLFTDHASHLQLLWESGFTYRVFSVLLRAILLNQTDATQYLCKQMGLGFGEIAPISAGSRPQFTWRLLDYATFYGIIEEVVSEFLGLPECCNPIVCDYALGKHAQSPEDELLVCVTFMEPSITKYIIEVLQWKHNLPAEKVAQMAIDLLKTDWQLEYFKFMGIETGPLIPEESVLEILLQYGPDPNQTKYWQTTLWKNILELDKIESDNISGSTCSREMTHVLHILQLFLNAGARVDRRVDLDIWGARRPSRNNLPEWETSEKREFFAAMDHAETPLEIAFSLETCWIFCLLITKSENTDKIHNWIASRCPSVLPGFIEALHNQDAKLLEAYWNTRIQILTPIAKAIHALHSGDLGTFEELIVQCKDHSQLLDIVLRLGEIASEASPGIPLTTNCQTLLQLLFEKGISFSSEPGFWDSTHNRHRDIYLKCLRGAIDHTALLLLELLLKFGILNETGYISYMIKERCAGLLAHAAYNSNLNAFKLLIENGFDVDNGFFLGSKKSCILETPPLFIAIENGDLDLATYILHQGGNIYVSCGGTGSAVEYALIMNRIDMVSLILEVYPDCYEVALGAVKRRGSKMLGHVHISDFIRNWKPGCATSKSYIQ
ncbi:hypothetical protein TWF679_005659 [Orbilia oligospora]|uniref:Clr5 domain-containing protein n=1 Tax=Orbilia oligospora TaxID=2813651 RepID=A0A8H8VBJ6_ORBOL|nr:hypothetical protein TWF679_005659 [Orbilia oligospora]